MRPDSGVRTGSAPITPRTTPAASAWSAPSASCSCSVESPTELFSSSGVPSATLRPRSMTAIRSASWSASSRYWVVSRIVQPLGDEAPDRVPHLAARARIQSGGRLVEEDQRRPRDQARGEVQAAAHAARELRERLRRGLLEPELLEQVARRRASLGGAQPLQAAEQPQVLGRGEVLVDRRVLAGDADQLADAVRLAGDVHAEDRRRAGVDRQQRGEHAEHRRLARRRSGPRTPKISPWRTSRSMPSTARKSPNVFTRPSARTAAVVIGGIAATVGGGGISPPTRRLHVAGPRARPRPSHVRPRPLR